uniref:Uncharacterized protein n=1 Tax=Arundo donax TaxID=35708 RepID=A0A0A8YHR9_ARUDO
MGLKSFIRSRGCGCVVLHALDSSFGFTKM